MGFEMNPSNLFKVVAAFLAGVVIVLGGALIYSRSVELRHPVEVAETAPTQEQPIAETEQPSAPVPAPAPSVDDKTRAVVPVPKTDSTSREIFPARIPETVAPPKARMSAPPAAPPELTSSVQPQDNAPQPYLPESTPLPPRQPNRIALPPGTILPIQLEDTLSTEHNNRGDAFRGTLDSPIVINGFIIADKGSTVMGRVVNVQRAHLIGGASDLTLTLTDINTTDGQLVKIQTSPWEKEGARAGIRNTAEGAVGSAIGAVVGAVNGAVKGAGFERGAGDDDRTNAPIGMKHRVIVLPIGARLTFRLASPITITE